MSIEIRDGEHFQLTKSAASESVFKPCVRLRGRKSKNLHYKTDLNPDFPNKSNPLANCCVCRINSIYKDRYPTFCTNECWQLSRKCQFRLLLGENSKAVRSFLLHLSFLIRELRPWFFNVLILVSFPGIGVQYLTSVIEGLKPGTV